MESNVQTVLIRRHKAAATTVAGLIIAVVLLSVVAFLGKDYFRQQAATPIFELAVRVLVLFLGLGSVLWRRRNLSTARLQEISTRRGPLGLVSNLEKTTLQIAVLGAAIAVIGFVCTLITGNELYTYWAGLIAIVVLLFHFPKRSFWSRIVERFGEISQKPA